MSPILFNALPGLNCERSSEAVAGIGFSAGGLSGLGLGFGVGFGGFGQPQSASPLPIEFQDAPAAPPAAEQDSADYVDPAWNGDAAAELLARAVETLGAACPEDFEFGVDLPRWERLESGLDRALAAQRWNAFEAAVDRWLRFGLRAFERSRRENPAPSGQKLLPWFDQLPAPRWQAA